MPSTPPGIGQPTREARTGREDRGQSENKWWTLVAVCLGTFMLLLDITIVSVALPDIQRALHSSFADRRGDHVRLAGAGGAIMFAVSLALLANAFRGKDRGVAFGVWGAVTGLAVAIGPLIGGVLTSGLS